MKLFFKKETDQNMVIQIVTGTTTIDFTYVDMIKELLIHKNIEEPIFEGDISEEEKDRIKSMLEKINSAMVEKEQV